MPTAGDDSDDDIGPSIPGAGETKKVHKKKKLAHEKLYLDNLPEADRYWKSFMHRDSVNFVTMTK